MSEIVVGAILGALAILVVGVGVFWVERRKKRQRLKYVAF